MPLKVECLNKKCYNVSQYTKYMYIEKIKKQGRKNEHIIN